MTTGICCSTPGCGHLAPSDTGRCDTCRIEASTATPWLRSLRLLINRAISGPEIDVSTGWSSRRDGDREAG
jgi:hypothetical protein